MLNTSVLNVAAVIWALAAADWFFGIRTSVCKKQTAKNE